MSDEEATDRDDNYARAQRQRISVKVCLPTPARLAPVCDSREGDRWRLTSWEGFALRSAFSRGRVGGAQEREEDGKTCCACDVMARSEERPIPTQLRRVYIAVHHQ